jgi:general secretion pathway protein D
MKLRRSIALAAACGLGAVLHTLNTQAQAQEAPRAGAVTMREVDIRAFIEDVSSATGRTFIIDPRVTGRVSVISQSTMSREQLFEVFLSTLRVNGYVAVPTAQGAYRIVPDAVAAREPATAGSGTPENIYVTQVFSLQFADAESVLAAVRPMLSERGQATVNRRNNSLVVVDFGATINRVRDVIARLDRDNSTFRQVRLRNTSAAEMARVAQSLAGGVGEEGGGRSLVQAVPVISSNTLLLRGDDALLGQIEPVLRSLDADAVDRSGVQVIALRYAVAEELVPILQQLSTSLAQTGENASRTANIAAHRPTNSLIISADPGTQETLASVVRSLDVRREQILVEAIIVEVSDTAAHELGLQFLLADPTASNAVPFLSTNFRGSAPNLLAITGALLAGDDDGENDSPALGALRTAAVNSILSSNGALFGAAGQRRDGTILGVILNALGEDRDSNILSTPSVLTLDNETASILVGQQIPITTGETVSDNLDNQFRTVRREDVGVKLEVRPQISEGGAIRLQISQEVSSIFGPIVSDSTDLITNRRAIDTVVQVDAGEVVVLGGLIQEDVQRNNSGVPLLRSIPVAGRLFSNEQRSRDRTNLMVFLRPTIVTTTEQARAATGRQYQAMHGLDPIVAERLREAIQRGGASQNGGPSPNVGAPRSGDEPRP